MFIEAKKKKFIPRMKRKEKFIIIHTLQTNFKQNAGFTNAPLTHTLL